MASGALTGYLQGTPPAQNPPIQRNYTQGALHDRVNAEIGCVIGREHAMDESQHASGASGPGRISIACGNIPAPGLGKSVCTRKFAPVGGANGNLQVIRELGCQKT